MRKLNKKLDIRSLTITCLLPGLHSRTCCISSWGNVEGVLSLPGSDSLDEKLASIGIRNASSSNKSPLKFHNTINLSKGLFLTHVIVWYKLGSSLWKLSSKMWLWGTESSILWLYHHPSIINLWPLLPLWRRTQCVGRYMRHFIISAWKGHPSLFTFHWPDLLIGPR